MDKIGALWLKDGPNGKFMSGVIGGKPVLVFKNKYKKQDNHPDYNVFAGQSKTELPDKKKEQRYEEEYDGVPF